jgi:crotonobetainyl-CoA:carnitine CoA-transferase CaiB-like acyl-CoA transferase
MIKPDIILTSISPFGQKGPYSHFKGSDIVLMAMGGYMYTCGDRDRAPLRIGFPQSCLFAGAEAAVGSLMAYYYRETTGKGQHVDVSAQHSITWTTLGYAWPFLAGISLSRVGQFRVGLSSEAKQRQLWQCRDGFVSFQIYGGKFGAKSNRALAQWMNEEGMGSDFLNGLDWENFDIAQAHQEIMNEIEDPIGRFFSTQAKARLEEEAIKRDFVLYPVCNMGDILANLQLKARGYWMDVEHDELGTSITYPGAWVQTSEKSSWKKRRAPLVGEHNEEIYRQEMAFSKEELIVLKETGVI